MPKKDWMVKQNDLDDDQLNVFNATLDKSCIVSGCADSGKSVLALIINPLNSKNLNLSIILLKITIWVFTLEKYPI